MLGHPQNHSVSIDGVYQVLCKSEWWDNFYSDLVWKKCSWKQLLKALWICCCLLDWLIVLSWAKTLIRLWEREKKNLVCQQKQPRCKACSVACTLPIGACELTRSVCTRCINSTIYSCVFYFPSVGLLCWAEVLDCCGIGGQQHVGLVLSVLICHLQSQCLPLTPAAGCGIFSETSVKSCSVLCLPNLPKRGTPEHMQILSHTVLCSKLDADPLCPYIQLMLDKEVRH